MYFFFFIILIIYCNFTAANDEVLNSIEYEMDVLETITQQMNAFNETTRNSHLILENLNKELNDKLALLAYLNVKNSCLPSSLDSGKIMPSNCAEALNDGMPDGIYKLHLPQSGLQPFYVYCMKDPQKNGRAWTIVQRRQDGSIDFYRDWQEYKYGFGNLDGEFFLGLQQLHALTQSQLHELWIQMEDFENVTRSARYTSFIIGDERSKYALQALGPYSGDAGDSLHWQAGCKFSTKDQDNDEDNDQDHRNCAKEFTGAWWYKTCHRSNLNGQYLRGEYPKNKYGQGVVWGGWHGYYYSLKYVHMAIRPVVQ